MERVCPYCQSTFTVPSKSPSQTFCSKPCFSKHYHKSEGRTVWDELEPIIHTCMNCNTVFTQKKKSRNPKFCGQRCAAIYNNLQRKKKPSAIESVESRKRYRDRCAFHFNIDYYKDWFDYSLVEQHGWFSKHGNIHGVVKDHMYSVFEGWKNGVDPSVVGHPANCALVLAKDNGVKGSKSSITLEELNERIKLWEEKYSGG